jgi:S-(hydroxymethyl)glutathione dehydrogenase/alcohol dehydrogenase
MKTVAAILVEQKKPLVIEEIEIPSLAYGQVLVKVITSGICGSQIGEIEGVKGPDAFLPHLLGHEGTAEVLECGPGVKQVRAGDRVALHWRPGAGLATEPPKYKNGRGVINAGWVTSFNRHAIVVENRMTRIPAELDADSGALLGCAVLTGFGVINNNARLRIGESVLVLGAGGIGLNVIQAAAMSGAYPVIAVDLHDNRLALAGEVGATHRINGRTEDIAERVKAITGSGVVDVAVENTGNPRMIEMAYELTAATGRTVLVGVPAKGQKASIYTLPLHFEKILTGSHGGEALPAYDIPRYARLVLEGKLNLKQLVAKRYGLEDINHAIADMKSGAVAGRCIVDM